MNIAQLIKRIKESAPAWLLSALLHGGILALAATITWVVLEPRWPEQVLTLAPPEAGVQETGEDAAVGGGAGAAGDLARAAERPASPLVAAAPAPKKMLENLPAALLPPLTDQTLAGLRDPSGVLTALPGGGVTGAPSAAGHGGGGLLEGTSPGFGKHIGDLRGLGLDIVLVLDATDSMSPYIEQAKVRLHAILDVVTGLVPNARIGMVAYKDYGDEYGPEAVKVVPLGNDPQVIRKFIDEITAGGGGDIPEPVHEALNAATSTRRMGWNPRRKRVIILVGDSPVHTSGRLTAFRLAAEFAKEGGVVNVIDTGGTGMAGATRTGLMPDLARIAKDGGGSAFLLKDAQTFWRYLIVSIFGERYEQDVNTIIDKFTKKEAPAGG